MATENTKKDSPLEGFDLYTSLLETSNNAGVVTKKHEAKITEFKQVLNKLNEDKIVHINAEADEFDEYLHTNAFIITNSRFESINAEKTFDHRLASVIEGGGSVVVDVTNNKEFPYTITQSGQKVQKTFHGHDSFGFFSYPDADLIPIDEMHFIKLNTYAVEDIFNYNGRYVDQAFDKKVIGYINATKLLSPDFFDMTDVNKLDMSQAINFKSEINNIFQDMNRLGSDHRFLVSHYDRNGQTLQKFFDRKADGSFFRSTDEQVCRYYISKALSSEGSIVLNKFKIGFYDEFPDVIYDSNAHAYVETKVYGLVLTHGHSQALSISDIKRNFNTDHNTGLPLQEDPLRTFGSWSNLRIKN